MNIGKIWRRVMGIPDPQPPMKDNRGLSEDWQVGDLARCKAGVWQRGHFSNPKIGDVLRVNAIDEGVSVCGTLIISGLGFEGKPSTMRWYNKSFVKIRPDHSADEIETGIIEKIKGVKV